MLDTRKYLDIQNEYKPVNFPGYDHPAEFRRLKPTDTLQISKVIRKSRKSLMNYLDWADRAGNWSFAQIQKWVMSHINSDDFYRHHFVFLINKEIVGMCSTAPVGDPYQVQLSYWVADGHQGRGVGTALARTIEDFAFRVIGWSAVQINHDATNRASGKIPQKLGYTWNGTFEGDNFARGETGFWYSWIKFRPEGLPPGILQGEDPEYFSQVVTRPEPNEAETAELSEP
tara:strand:- start:3126 stop:3812 length:687 start_codon:yes stop_codon:yes gene_type:complete